MLKQYVIRKYVMAENAQGAIAQDKLTDVHDAFVDVDWKEKTPNIVPEKPEQVSGFALNKPDEISNRQ